MDTAEESAEVLEAKRRRKLQVHTHLLMSSVILSRVVLLLFFPDNNLFWRP